MPEAVAEAEPESDVFYQRAARSLAKYRWWKPLITTVAAVFLWITLQSWVSIIGITWDVIYQLNTGSLTLSDLDYLNFGTTFMELLAVYERVDINHLGSFLVSILAVASALPAIIIACLMTGVPTFGLLSSVANRLRWRLLLGYLAPAIVVFVITILADAASRGSLVFEVTPVPNLWLMIVLILLLIPFQAAAEEYLIRGLAMQTLGSWLKRPIFVVVIPSLLFALLHPYNIWGFLAIFVFAVAASLITLRTGGLEAAIALHVVNNVLIFLAQALTSDTSSSDADSGDWLTLVWQALMCALFTAYVYWHAGRKQLTNTVG